MKISKGLLSKFLKAIKLSGEVENKEAIFDVSKDKIVSLILSSNKVVAIKGELKGKFDDLGKIGIDDLIALTNFVALFKEDINIDVQKNKIILKENKLKISCVLRATQYILNNLDETKFITVKDSICTPDSNSFVLSKETISQILTYSASLKTSEIQLIGAGKSIIFSTTDNENEVISEFEVKKDVKFSVKLGKAIIEVLSALEEEVTVFIKDGVPSIYLCADSSDIKIELLVAPLK